MTAPPTLELASAIRPNRRYGWVPDLPDANDFKFPKSRMALRVPPRMDLRKTGWCSPIKNQGSLGSCTGNGIARLDEFAMRRQGQADVTDRSRLFIYYGEREIEETIPVDAGAMIRDGMKVIEKLGAPAESLWPYDIPAFSTKPTEEAYHDALLHQAVTYNSVDSRSETSIKSVIAGGTPITFGFTVYPWFEEVGPSGEVRIPSDVDDYGKVLGGHCVDIEGYDSLKLNPKRTVYAIVPNSWGTSWGDQGYCYFPLNWITKPYNADDFWTLLMVE